MSAPRCLAAVLLVVAVFRVPRRSVAVDGTIPANRNQVGSLVLVWRNARLDTGCPGWLAEPADAAGDPEQSPSMVFRIHVPHGGQLLLHRVT